MIRHEPIHRLAAFAGILLNQFGLHLVCAGALYRLPRRPRQCC